MAHRHAYGAAPPSDMRISVFTIWPNRRHPAMILSIIIAALARHRLVNAKAIADINVWRKIMLKQHLIVSPIKQKLMKAGKTPCAVQRFVTLLSADLAAQKSRWSHQLVMPICWLS